MKKLKKSYYDRENRLGAFMSIEQEYTYYNEVLERVIRNPRYYLNHLEELDVFEVSFIDYKRPAGRKKKPL